MSADPQVERTGVAASRGRLRRLVLFVAVALVARAALRGVEIVDLDEAAYLTVARELLRGARLYTDVADHKPPLLFLYYALAQLFGGGMLPVRLLTDLVTVPLTAFAASAFFRHDRRGKVAGLLLLVYGSAFIGHDVLAVNCELLMMLPLSWALVLVRDPRSAGSVARAAAAGVLVGTAALFKYQAAPWIAPVALAVALASPGGRALRVLVALLGAAAPPLAAWAAFAASGGAADFLYWNLGHNLQYVRHAPSAAEAGVRALAYALPFLLTTAPLWWLAARGLRQLPPPEREGGGGTARHQAVLLASAAAVALATAVLGGRFYPHYFVPLYLPAGLAAAPQAERMLRRPVGRAGRTLVAVSLLLWTAFSAANAYLYLRRDDVYVETRPVYEEVASRLRRDPCFGEGRLFVWGFAPSFYAATGLAPASRFIFVNRPLVTHGPGHAGGADDNAIRAELWQWLMADLRRSRPSYVLDTSAARLSRWSAPVAEFPQLAGFLASGYAPLDVVDGVMVYRRRGCTAR